MIRSAFLLILTLIAMPSFAELKLPRVLSDGAVIQREMPYVLWGWGNGDKVEVFIDGKKAGKAKIKDGEWKLKLKPRKASGPHVIRFVSGEDQVEISNIYFGDLWMAAGQSNMETTMSRARFNYADEVANVRLPMVRHYSLGNGYNFGPPAKDYDHGEWKEVSPENIGPMSAVAHFFAKELHRETGVAIGILNTAVGGSAAEAWMSKKALEKYPHYLEKVKTWEDLEHLEATKKADSERSNAWNKAFQESDQGFQGTPWHSLEHSAKDWDTTLIPGYWGENGVKNVVGSIWYKRELILPSDLEAEAAQLWLGTIVNADTVWVNGERVGGVGYQYPPRRYTVAEGILKPGKNVITIRVTSNGNGGFIPDKKYHLKNSQFYLDLSGEWRYKIGTEVERPQGSKFSQWGQPYAYGNALLPPVENLKFKGVAWYQGESNVSKADEYEQLLTDMIADWRDRFNQPNLPFLIVQLPNFLAASDQPQDSAWAKLRDAQRSVALADNRNALVVAIDAGEWNELHPLNKKPIGERLALAARKLVYGDKRLLAEGPSPVCFAQDGAEVLIKFSDIGNGLSSKGEALTAFAVAGQDGKYQWADAKLSHSAITLSLREKIDVKSIRYAWADNPNANLYNAEGLPASPFQLSKVCQ
jgi:sialate O-acetylesterase